MLTKKAQINIITELLKNRNRSGDSWVRDDHIMDCQLIMPNSAILAVVDFRDAVLNADRFRCLPDSATRMIMDFNPADHDEIIMDGYYNLGPRATKLVSFRYAADGKDKDKRFFIQQKYLAMVDYHPSEQAMFIKCNDKGIPLMCYLWDCKREELDAMICPFRVMEDGDNDDQSE